MATYQGVLHMHSTYSYDGTLSLSELKTLLQENGVSFACMSEHTDYLTSEAAEAFVRECRELSDETFVFVPGFELPFADAHILLMGCEVFPGQVATDVAALRTATASAALTVLAHPLRNHFTLSPEALQLMQGIEIWNQQYDGKVTPRFHSVAMAESVRQDRPLLVTGGQDFHRAEHFGAPLTTLELPALSEDAIVKALQQGRYQFGSAQLSIGAWQAYAPSVTDRVLGVGSRLLIAVGKRGNAMLAFLNLPRPKWLARLIRRFV